MSWAEMRTWLDRLAIFRYVGGLIFFLLKYYCRSSLETVSNILLKWMRSTNRSILMATDIRTYCTIIFYTTQFLEVLIWLYDSNIKKQVTENNVYYISMIHSLFNGVMQDYTTLKTCGSILVNNFNPISYIGMLIETSCFHIDNSCIVSFVSIGINKS